MRLAGSRSRVSAIVRGAVLLAFITMGDCLAASEQFSATHFYDEPHDVVLRSYGIDRQELPRLYRQLRKALRSGRFGERQSALDAVDRLNLRSMAPHIADYIHSQTATTERMHAVVVLARLRTPEARELLVAMAKGAETDVRVRATAVRSLTCLENGETMMRALRELVEDDDLRIAVSAGEALSLFGDDAGLAVAQRAVSSDECSTWQSGFAVLRNLGGARVREILKEIRIDEDSIKVVDLKKAIVGNRYMSEPRAKRLRFLLDELSDGVQKVWAADELFKLARDGNGDALRAMREIALDWNHCGHDAVFGIAQSIFLLSPEEVTHAAKKRNQRSSECGK